MVTLLGESQADHEKKTQEANYQALAFSFL